MKDYISDQNHLPYANHRYPTRSKDKDAPFVSYSGQASATVTGNKGSRKRAISDEENVNTARSPLQNKKKGVVEHKVPGSMIEDVTESISVEGISSSSNRYQLQQR